MGRPRKYVKEHRPFNFLLIVEKGGKIIDQREYSWINEAYAFKFKREKEEGVKVEIRRIQNETRRITPKKRQAMPREKKGWMESVRCVETGKSYECVRYCELDTGISGYRIRRGADTGKVVDGFHFEWITKHH